MSLEIDTIREALSQLSSPPRKERQFVIQTTREGMERFNKIMLKQWLETKLNIQIQSGSFKKDEGKTLQAMLDSESTDDFELATMIINQK